jgi:hypothetical protein
MKARRFSISSTLAEINSRQTPADSRQWRRLAGGNPLGYRRRQPSGNKSRNRKSNFRHLAAKIFKESLSTAPEARFLNIPFNSHTAKIYEKTRNESVRWKKKQRRRANQVSGD